MNRIRRGISLLAAVLLAGFAIGGDRFRCASSTFPCDCLDNHNRGCPAPPCHPGFRILGVTYTVCGAGENVYCAHCADKITCQKYQYCTYDSDLDKCVPSGLQVVFSEMKRCVAQDMPFNEGACNPDCY
jgi:hypothetical protein